MTNVQVTRRGLQVAAAIALTGIFPSVGLAQPVVHCEMIPLVGIPGDDLGGRFMYLATVKAPQPFELTSHLLVLDREGEIIQEISIGSGETFQISLRDNVIIDHHDNGPFDWLIHAPGVLFRAHVEQGFLTDTSYCGPFAAIRFDLPDDVVFVSNTTDPKAPARLTIGVAEMDPDTIEIAIDCVDIIEATGASFPGGPFEGTAEIASADVTIENLVADLEKGTISFILRDLPGGTHFVSVAGTPSYIDSLPPGHVHWNRPLGALSHEDPIYVFRTVIAQPEDGDLLPFEPTRITGTLTHGLPIESLRLHGADVVLPPAEFIPGDDCVGAVFRIPFDVTLPTAELLQDFAMGNDELSAMDPGINFVSALAADNDDHVSNDRVRIGVGTLIVPLDDPAPPLVAPSEDCDPVQDLPGFVKHGLAVSLSQPGLEQSIRAKKLADLVATVTTELEGLVGANVNVLLDPCPGTPEFAGDSSGNAQVPHRLTKSRALEPQRRALARGSNSPPVWEPIPNQSVSPLSSLTIPLIATDPDRDPIDFLPGSLPPNSDIIEKEGYHIFAFTPSCADVGNWTVSLVATDGISQVEEHFDVDVSEPKPVGHNPIFTDISFDARAMDLHVCLVDEDEVAISFDSGPITMSMFDSDCVGNCLFCCCLTWGVGFDIVMSNVRLTTVLNSQQILCGLQLGEELPPLEVDISGLHTVLTSCDLGGCFGWLFEIFCLQFLDIFEHGRTIAQHINDTVKATEDELEDAIANQFQGAGNFAGIGFLQFSTDLLGVLTLDLRREDIAVIEPDVSLSMGIFSDFTPVNAVDGEPPWIDTFSSLPDAGSLGADLMVATSDDALNQMMSAIVATGLLRHQFRELTLGEVLPGYDLLLPGVDENTEMVLTVDAAQDSDGNAIPPIVSFVDNPNTDALEIMARLQVTMRGVLERNGILFDDRDLCACTDIVPECLGEPCVLFEAVLKINFFTSLSLTIERGPVATLRLTVDEIQILKRDEGFDSFEDINFSEIEEQIIDLLANSPLLELLRQTLNEEIPPLTIPQQALTLDGFVMLDPYSLRLFSATVDNSGLGDQDYIGLLADIVLERPQLPACNEP